MLEQSLKSAVLGRKSCYEDAQRCSWMGFVSSVYDERALLDRVYSKAAAILIRFCHYTTSQRARKMVKLLAEDGGCIEASPGKHLFLALAA